MMGMPGEGMGQFSGTGGGNRMQGMGGRTMDTAAMRQMRQRFQNMPQAQRDSLRRRFNRQGNQQGGQRQSNQNGGARQNNQQTQQTDQPSNNR